MRGTTISDNTQINPGVSGDIIRTIDRSLDNPPGAAKTQVVAIDTGGEAGPEQLANSIAKETSGNLDQHTYLLTQILIELRTITLFLQSGLNVRDEPDSIRLDQLNQLPF